MDKLINCKKLYENVASRIRLTVLYNYILCENFVVYNFISYTTTQYYYKLFTKNRFYITIIRDGQPKDTLWNKSKTEVSI